MARTQQINFSNGTQIVATGVYQPLFPDRPYNRIGALVKNLSANLQQIKAPSGAIYPLDAGATIQISQGFFMEDGAYEITGTIGDLYMFWEAY